MRILPLVALVGLGWTTSADAASVSGTVSLPSGFKTELDKTPSLWLVENGFVPIAPPLQDPRTHMVVVLEGGRKADSPSRAVTVYLRDMMISPRVVPVVAGTSVDFKNEDRAIHMLYAPNDKGFSAQAQSPGGLRTYLFGSAGEFEIRCKKVPHMRGTVLALPSVHFAVPQAGGSYEIENVPPGSYNLKVWYAGEYIYGRSVEIKQGAVAVDVRLKKTAPEKGGQ